MKGEDGWSRFALDGLQPLDLAEPVCHISYYEADALCPLGRRAAADRGGMGERRGGARSRWRQPARCRRPGPPASAERRPAIFGDVWEWTGSAYLPYPGFQPAPGAVGEYNGKFMCSQMVLRGGCCATPRGHVRASYRNFFYPHQRWMFSGLRLARTPDDRPTLDPAFRADVLAGLAAPIPAMPARWLYDRRGSELFEEITRLPEYYPTRTETALLERYSGEIAARLGTGEAVVEFGSGSSAKTPILLRAVRPSAYVPVDISGDFLREIRGGAAGRISRPARSIRSRPISPARSICPAEIAAAPKLGFFPGSTIGNFVARSAVDLLRAMKETLGEGSRLVIGMDRIKDVDVLLARL